MRQSEQINELATALALAQGELENAAKKSDNPHFRSKYADLAEILNTVRPVFSKNGLSVTQFPSYDGGILSVETMLMHKSGQWLSGTISAPVSKQDAQGVGSATTYCRRYSLAAVAGLAQEDDDANAAVGHRPKAEVKFIDGGQISMLEAIIDEVQANREQFCKFMKVAQLSQIPANMYDAAKSALDAKRAKK